MLLYQQPLCGSSGSGGATLLNTVRRVAVHDDATRLIRETRSRTIVSSASECARPNCGFQNAISPWEFYPPVVPTTGLGAL